MIYRVVLILNIFIAFLLISNAQSDEPTLNIHEQRLGSWPTKGHMSNRSSDGCHIGFIVSYKGNFHVEVDGKSGPEYKNIHDSGPIFSPDSKRVAYGAQKGKKWLLVVDGQPGPEYDHISEFTFSPDSKRVAYGAQKGKKWLLVVDGQQGSEYDHISEFTFSPDSKRMVYAAKRGENWLVVADSQPDSEYNAVNSPTFSPDGGKLVYIAREGGMFVISCCPAVRMSDIPDQLEYKKLYQKKRDWVNKGNSCIVDPSGNFIAEPLEAQQAILYAEIDLDDIPPQKCLYDVAGHYSRPDVFEFGIKT